MAYRYNPFSGQFDRIEDTGDAQSDVETLEGNSGGKVGADATQNIKIIGGGVYTVTGDPGTSTLTITDDGTVSTSFVTDSGTATPSSHVLNVLGGTGLNTEGSSSNLIVNIDVPVIVSNGGTGSTTLTGVLTGNGTSAFTASTVTENGVLYGGSSNAINSAAVGTNGQVLLGATGAAPLFATLTSTDGSITFTAGANSLDLSAASSGSVINVTSLDDTDSPYTALSTEYYFSCDVSGGVLTIDLPDAPTTGTVYIVKDSGGDAASNNITITTTGGSINIDGATTFVMNTDYEAAQFVFTGSVWEVF